MEQEGDINYEVKIIIALKNYISLEVNVKNKYNVTNDVRPILNFPCLVSYSSFGA